MLTSFPRSFVLAGIALIGLGASTASAQFRTPRVTYGPPIISATPYYTGLQAQQYAAMVSAYSSLPSYGYGYGVNANPYWGTYGSYAYNPNFASYSRSNPFLSQGATAYRTPYANQISSYYATPYGGNATTLYSNVFGSYGVTNYVNPYTGPGTYYWVQP